MKYGVPVTALEVARDLVEARGLDWDKMIPERRTVELEAAQAVLGPLLLEIERLRAVIRSGHGLEKPRTLTRTQIDAIPKIGEADLLLHAGKQLEALKKLTEVDTKTLAALRRGGWVSDAPWPAPLLTPAGFVALQRIKKEHRK